MNFLNFIFYFFSALAILSALGMITVRNPVHAILFLVLTFFDSAALWITLHADFLGIVLVLVYVGAVMVLFLFVIMMLDINIARMRQGFIRFLPLGIVVALLMVIELALVLGTQYFQRVAGPVSHEIPSTTALGRVVYTQYVYPFEIAAVILLVAIIAAISLTLRRRRIGTKYQRPGNQVKVNRRDRVRLVKMPAEKKL